MMTRRTRELLCLFVLFHCTVKAAEEQIVEFSNESDVDPFAESLYTGNIPPFIKVRRISRMYTSFFQGLTFRKLKPRADSDSYAELASSALNENISRFLFKMLR